MKGLLVLAALLGWIDSDQPSHYLKKEGDVLVSGASLWKVNQATKVSQRDVIRTYHKAFLSKKADGKKRDISLVFWDEGPAVELGLLEEQDKPEAKLLLGRPDFFKLKDDLQLLVSELGIDDRDSTLDTTLGKMEAAAVSEKSPVATFRFMGKTPVHTTVANNQLERLLDVPDRSLFVEWGHELAIKLIRDSLEKLDSDGNSQLARRIYERHFIKIPLFAEITKSNKRSLKEKTSERAGYIDPLFLVKPRGYSKGYLLHFSKVERDPNDPNRTIPTLIAIQVPNYTYDPQSKSYTVEVPARCFIEKILRPAVGDTELNFQEPGDRLANVAKLFGSLPESDEEGATKYETLKFVVPETLTAPKLVLPLHFENRDFSYSLILGSVDDGTPAITDTTPLIVYTAQDECAPLLSNDRPFPQPVVRPAAAPAPAPAPPKGPPKVSTAPTSVLIPNRNAPAASVKINVNADKKK